MATRINIARERGLGEDSNIPDYSADDYVTALREGSTFGNEIYDLRGNILRLADYVKKYDTLRDGVLYLKNRLDTPYALLVFGEHQRMFKPKSKLSRDLSADATWNQVTEIRGVGEELFASVVERKFGTGHKKMLLMIGPKSFKGQIKKAPQANVIDNFDASKITTFVLNKWIESMSHP